MARFLSAALLAASLSAAHAAGASAEKKILYSAYGPIKHVVSQSLLEMMDRVEEETDGDVTFDLEAGGDGLKLPRGTMAGDARPGRIWLGERS